MKNYRFKNINSRGKKSRLLNYERRSHNFKLRRFDILKDIILIIFSLCLGFLIAKYDDTVEDKKKMLSSINLIKYECGQNLGNGHEINKILLDGFNSKKLFPKMSYNTTQYVLQKPNILDIMDIDMYNLLSGYVQACENINYMLPLYTDHIIASNYIFDDNLKLLKENVRNYNSFFLAYTNLIKNELRDKYKIKYEYTLKSKEYNCYIDSLKNLYLQNKINLFEYPKQD